MPWRVRFNVAGWPVIAPDNLEEMASNGKTGSRLAFEMNLTQTRQGRQEKQYYPMPGEREGGMALDN
jgi:hypothetical protein